MKQIYSNVIVLIFTSYNNYDRMKNDYKCNELNGT